MSTTLANLQYRHELKFGIPAGEAIVISRRLGALLPRDGHAGPDGRYTVRSLYFDTPFDDALREKHEGVSTRAKWRLRTYGNDVGANGCPIHLEKKTKRNGLGQKHKEPLNLAQAYLLAEGGVIEPALLEALSDINDTLGSVGIEFCQLTKSRLLAPKAVVIYEREAFRYRAGNVRVTIDTAVRVCARPAAFFAENPLMTPAAPGEAVVEVKYDDYLPDWIADAVSTSTARTAWSKYTLARRYE